MTGPDPLQSGRLRVRILGCGSSSGVPRIGGDWGACDPNDPRNRRTRCSILVERQRDNGPWREDATTRILVDTSPDFRFQMLEAEAGRVDAVLFSHDHADQTHGIDDLRALAIRQRQRIAVHMDRRTADILMNRFAYCFEDNPKTGYPAILDAHIDLEHGKRLEIDGPGGVIPVLPLLQVHGPIPSLGFRFGPIAYSNDCSHLSEETLRALTDLDVWIVDALREAPHPTHANVDQALAWAEELAPRRVILTNLHIDLDYAYLDERTPSHVEPAVDGLSVELALSNTELV